MKPVRIALALAALVLSVGGATIASASTSLTDPATQISVTSPRPASDNPAIGFTYPNCPQGAFGPDTFTFTITQANTSTQGWITLSQINADGSKSTIQTYQANFSGPGTYTVPIIYPGFANLPIITGSAGSTKEFHVDIAVGAFQGTTQTFTFDGTINNQVALDYDVYCNGSPPPPTGFGTRTIGYWKNHTTSWPVTSVQVGCSVLTESQALAILQSASAKDMTSMLAAQLIGAELNVAAGGPTTAQNSISAANSFLCSNPVGSNPQGSLRTQAESLKNQLEAYNVSQDKG